jgi:hypothetical protein
MSSALHWWRSEVPKELLGISEDDVVKKVMMKDGVDGEL